MLGTAVKPPTCLAQQLSLLDAWRSSLTSCMLDTVVKPLTCFLQQLNLLHASPEGTMQQNYKHH